MNVHLPLRTETNIAFRLVLMYTILVGGGGYIISRKKVGNT